MPGPAAARPSPIGVLMLTKGLGRGGTERLVAGTVRHLDRERFRPVVAYLLPWKDALVGEIEGAGASVHLLEARRPTSLGWVRRLRRLVRDEDIGIVHTHMPLPAVVARLALGRRGPLIVHTEHNVWPRYRWPTRWANRLTYRRNRAVIAVSAGVAASIRSSVPVEVVLHGAEPPEPTSRDSARHQLGLADDDLAIGCVGNFTAKKDHTTLLQAFAIVRRHTHAARLVLVGTGPLEDDLVRLTGDLELDDRVLFTGSRGDVPQLLAAFDVFALSSQFEGLPIALLEAMGAGVACVATAVGGIPEVVTDGVDGVLVEPGDAVVLSDAIVSLLADPHRRRSLAVAGQRRAARFQLDAAVERIEDVYDRVLAPC